MKRYNEDIYNCNNHSNNCNSQRNNPHFIPIPGPQGPQGLQGLPGPAGAIGPQGIAGPTMGLSGIQTQLTGAPLWLIPDKANMIFNTTVNNPSPNIVYNRITGEFTLLEIGNYYVTWWVTVDSAGASTEIIFSLEVSGDPSISVSSAPPNLSMQLNGSALLTVTKIPTIISLVNNTGGDVNLANNSVQANIIIMKCSPYASL